MNTTFFAPLPARTSPWLSIIGIGEDGLVGISPIARQAIADAKIVYGGARHLALAAEAISGEARQWPSPLENAYSGIVQLRGQQICVLASGDPFHYGIGASLMRVVAADEMLCVPHISAFSLAAARLGWPVQDVSCLSLHGRPLERIIPHLQDGRRIIALTSDEHGPSALAQLMAARGFGPSRITVLEALGGPSEKMRTALAQEFDPGTLQPLNVVAVEVMADSSARIIPLTSGMPDDWFEHDGQITKRDIRAMTLSALAPRQGDLLWDIGGGAGSVAIEWMLAHPSLKAITLEQHAERAQHIARNALNFGVPDLKIIHGFSADIVPTLPLPDAVFVGGGGHDSALIDVLVQNLKPKGRLVMNAVTLETEAELLRRYAILGGELRRISIARAEPVGRRTGWRAAMPVTQWVYVK
jgi:precorrin-6Y C5,15-methyltransferase (decarboxylating)